MGSLGVPEVLIIVGAVAALGLGVYNWMYWRHEQPHK
jgi:hypothetical protein